MLLMLLAALRSFEAHTTKQRRERNQAVQRLAFEPNLVCELYKNRPVEVDRDLLGVVQMPQPWPMAGGRNTGTHGESSHNDRTRAAQALRLESSISTRDGGSWWLTKQTAT